MINHQIGYNLKTSLATRSFSFGIGERKPNLVKSKSLFIFFSQFFNLFSALFIEDFKKFPEPGAYRLPSDFEKSDTIKKTGGKIFSFGASRNAYDRVYYKERIPADRSIPGPGKYDQEAGTMKMNKNLSYTMKGRLPNECKFAESLYHFFIIDLLFYFFTIAHIAIKVNNPGPGTYKDVSDRASDGRYITSTAKNINCTPTMKLPTR